jgi:hypothetical protein
MQVNYGALGLPVQANKSRKSVQVRPGTNLGAETTTAPLGAPNLGAGVPVYGNVRTNYLNAPDPVLNSYQQNASASSGLSGGSMDDYMTRANQNYGSMLSYAGAQPGSNFVPWALRDVSGGGLGKPEEFNPWDLRNVAGRQIRATTGGITESETQIDPITGEVSVGNKIGNRSYAPGQSTYKELLSIANPNQFATGTVGRHGVSYGSLDKDAQYKAVQKWVADQAAKAYQNAQTQFSSYNTGDPTLSVVGSLPSQNQFMNDWMSDLYQGSGNYGMGDSNYKYLTNLLKNAFAGTKYDDYFGNAPAMGISTGAGARGGLVF